MDNFLYEFRSETWITFDVRSEIRNWTKLKFYPWNAHLFPIGRRFLGFWPSVIQPGHHVLLGVEGGAEQGVDGVNVGRDGHRLRDALGIVHSPQHPARERMWPSWAGDLCNWKFTCGCRGQSLRNASPTPSPGETWCGRCGLHTGKPGCRARRCSRSSSPQCAPSSRSPGRRDPDENWPAITFSSLAIGGSCFTCSATTAPESPAPTMIRSYSSFSPCTPLGSNIKLLSLKLLTHLGCIGLFLNTSYIWPGLFELGANVSSCTGVHDKKQLFKWTKTKFLKRIKLPEQGGILWSYSTLGLLKRSKKCQSTYFFSNWMKDYDALNTGLKIYE